MTLAQYLAAEPAQYMGIGTVELTGEEPEADVYWNGPFLVVVLHLPIGNGGFVGHYEVWPSNGILFTTTGRWAASCFRLIAYPLENHCKKPANPSPPIIPLYIR